MATWLSKVNKRLTGSEVAITGEAHTIGEHEANTVYLKEVPKAGTTVTITGYTEVSGAPGDNQFKAHYDNDDYPGKVEFNSLDNGLAITVDYTGTGSYVHAVDVNRIQTEKVDRDGAVAMTGPLKAAVGSVSAPGLVFGSDTNSGFYWISEDVIGLAINGIEIARFSSAGITAKDFFKQ